MSTLKSCFSEVCGIRPGQNEEKKNLDQNNSE